MRILLVEDDHELADYVSRGLEEENNSVTVCFDGAEALAAAFASHFDVIVLDVMLPSVDGLEVTKRLRAARNATPILLLTGRDAPMDVVRGLDAGADDYLTKPFSFDVLLARLRARTRGQADEGEARLRFADLTMDVENHKAWRGRTPLQLTPKEYSILESLVRSAGRMVTRQRLIDTAWGSDCFVGNNNLDVFLSLLRAKVDLPGHVRLIQTVRGVGYRLQERE
jgi:DNA-binding response OmpR family regulator